MGGKSTYMRQTALIVILAHIGSFVPADAAVIGPIDRIFTRIGAADDLTGGRSTFMVEMTETANILNSATRASLVLMDEVGRGTSTFDGLSLAWAAARHIAQTHRRVHVVRDALLRAHEPARGAARGCNVHLTATEHGRELIFLHSVKAGPASQSYGLHVAELAGVPRDVVERAREYLRRLEKHQRTLLPQSPQSELSFEPPAPPSDHARARRASRDARRRFAVAACSTRPAIRACATRAGVTPRPRQPAARDRARNRRRSRSLPAWARPRQCFPRRAANSCEPRRRRLALLPPSGWPRDTALRISIRRRARRRRADGRHLRGGVAQRDRERSKSLHGGVGRDVSECPPSSSCVSRKRAAENFC